MSMAVAFVSTTSEHGQVSEKRIASQRPSICSFSNILSTSTTHSGSRGAGSIWQCPEGHIFCAACYSKLGGAHAPCPTCATPLLSIRSRVLEKLRDRSIERLLAAAAASPISNPGACQDGGFEPGGSNADAAPSAQEEAVRVEMHADAPSDADAALEVQRTIQRNIAAVAAAVAEARDVASSSEEEDAAAGVGGEASEERGQAVRELSGEELKAMVQSSRGPRMHLFVMLYVSGSKDCRRFMHVWNALHRRFASTETVLIAKLNCSADRARAIKDYNIKRFPTLHFYAPDAEQGQALEAGHRADSESLRQWICTSAGIEHNANVPHAHHLLACRAHSRAAPALNLGLLNGSCDRPACSVESARRGALLRRALLRGKASKGDSDGEASMMYASAGRRRALRAVIARDPEVLQRAKDGGGNNLLLIAAGAATTCC
jgi:hypothetical protein